MPAMILALTPSHAAPAFNGLFFATIATVIPVLFLARRPGRLLRRAPAPGAADRPRPASRRVAAPLPTLRYLPRVMMGIAFLIVAAGFYGEADSILTLYFQRDSHGSGVVILVSALILTLAVVAGPMSSYLTAIDKLTDSFPEPGGRAASAGYGPGYAESSRPGTDETDAS